MLSFEGKFIVKKLLLKGVVKKCFKEFKGLGIRKLYYKFKDFYSGVFEWNVYEVFLKFIVY